MKKRTSSQWLLFILLLVYILVIGLGIFTVVYCIQSSEFDYAIQCIISLFSLAGVCGSVGMGFYSKKAQEENIRKIENDKYRQRMTLASEMLIALKNGEIDEQSIKLFKELISDENSLLELESQQHIITEPIKKEDFSFEAEQIQINSTDAFG